MRGRCKFRGRIQLVFVEPMKEFGKEYPKAQNVTFVIHEISFGSFPVGDFKSGLHRQL